MGLLKNLLKLIIIFLIIDSIISFALLELSKISKIRYSRIYYEKINADVIFIGNSRGRNSFNAPYFEKLSGKKSINFSYNALPISLAKIFLDDYLELNQSPEIIFIEVHCIAEGYYGLLNFKQYMLSSDSLKKMVKKNYPKHYYASLISKSYLFNSEYFIRTLYHITKNDQSWTNRFRIDNEYYNNLKNEDVFLFNKVDESSMKIFIEMIQKYKKQGITIIPVFAPIIDKCSNEDNIKNYIADFESRTKLKILNYSKAVNDISMFADILHTNDKGAVYITKKIYDFIKLNNPAFF